MAALGFIVLVTGSTGVFNRADPQSDSVIYRQTAAPGGAEWISASGVPDSWTRQFLGNTPQISFNADYFLGVGFAEYWSARAPLLRLPAPTVRLVRDVTSKDRRTIELFVKSNRGAPNITVLEHAAVGRLRAFLNGVPVGAADASITTESGIVWYLDYYDMPPGGARLTLEVDARKPVSLTFADHSFGLPPSLLLHVSPRPSANAPTIDADATVVEQDLVLGPGPA